MPSLGAEVSAVQSPMLRYAQDIGWQLVPQAEALKRRGGETGLVFRERFTDQFIAFNKAAGLNGVHAAEVLKRLLTLPARIEGNRDMLALLRGETSVYHAARKREINVKIIDYENPSANVFEVTPEWRFTNGKEHNRYDGVFLINGLPILLAETKAAHKPDAIAQGIDQIRRYHEETPEMMTALQMFDVTQLRELWYGVTWSLERKNLFRWRTDEMGDYEAAIKAFCDRERVLRMLADFIVFATKDDDLRKYILRQHQTRAVDKVVERCADDKKRRGLVWHTQGSGKTFTMITAARKLLQDERFGKPTVLMLVDRNELESQLFANLTSVGVPHIVTENKRHVQELLGGDYRGLIVSMIHKFDGLAKDVNTRPDVFVLIDEAHRSMYLDKPMRDHVLLQAIARVNRPYEGSDGRVKPAGFVLDFVGIFDNLESALSFDSDEVQSVIENIDLLKATFKVRLGELRDEWLPLAQGQSDKDAEAAVAAFTDREKRLRFFQRFKDLESMYETISPDAFLRDFIDDYLALARLYELVRAWFSRRPVVDLDLLRKTQALVQRHMAAGDMAGPLKRYEINEQTLEALNKGKTGEIDKLIAEHPYREVNPENMRQLRLRLTAALMKPIGKDRVADAIDRLLAQERHGAWKEQ